MTAPKPHATAARFGSAELAEFKRSLLPLIGFNLEGFKERQLERRLGALMHRAGMATLADYLAYLTAHPDRLQALVDGLTINVSEFFRDPPKFDELARDVLPGLLGRFERLRVWSAGCSMGAELYSVGILLDELGALDRCELFGTDMDRHVLERAREGLYPASEVEAVSSERLERYFEPVGGRYRLASEAIRSRCTFQRHNLFQDAFEGGWHLVLCRNVVIYFNDQSKQRIFRSFFEALEPGGVYFVGRSERILESHRYGFRQLAPFFYQRPTD